LLLLANNLKKGILSMHGDARGLGNDYVGGTAVDHRNIYQEEGTERENYQVHFYLILKFVPEEAEKWFEIMAQMEGERVRGSTSNLRLPAKTRKVVWGRGGYANGWRGREFW
jgi:hypothetical protein